MEFAPDGHLARSLGEGMFVRAYAIRVDPAGNIGMVDNDTRQLLKMAPSGRVRMVLGRHLGRDPILQSDSAAAAVTGARSLARDLHIRAKLDHVEQHLGAGLGLQVAAHDAQ
ncbi:MAG: hypothetical protein OXN89_11465 [Bryobacterales bacterium]|nr:hypothetical protein [Bryobacterales bacterium]